MKKVAGALSFIVGIILLVSSQSGITGNVISEVAGSLSSIFGLMFIVGGLVFMGLGGKDLDTILLDTNILINSCKEENRPEYKKLKKLINQQFDEQNPVVIPYGVVKELNPSKMRGKEEKQRAGYLKKLITDKTLRLGVDDS